MQAKLLFLFTFIISTSFALAQGTETKINKPFNLSPKAYELPRYSLNLISNLPNSSFVSYTTTNFPMPLQQYGPMKEIWLGQSYQTVFRFKNLILNTNYNFDMNGVLKNTNSNIQVNKFIQYRLF